MICSANTNVTLPFTVGGAGPVPSIAFDPGIKFIFEDTKVGKLLKLFEQASNALGLALNLTHSYKEIKTELLTNLMACDSNPRYERASFLLPYDPGRRRCGDEPDKTIDEARKLLRDICRLHPTTGCEMKELSSKEAFTKSLALGMEDVARIAECFFSFDDPKEKKEILAIGRELLNLQRKVSDTHYLFTHGMSRVHALLPKLITELDHRLRPKRDSKGFIFARVIPPAKPQTHLSEIFRQLDQGEDDHDLRNELLCADADLLNRKASESALDFYLKNINVFDRIYFIVCDILTKFSEEFGMDHSMIRCEDDLEFQFKTLARPWDILGTRGRWGSGRGALLAYVVPKILIHNPNTNFVYTSFPFGKPVNKVEPLAQLSELAAGRVVKEHGISHRISVRLLTSHLRPENGIKAFWVGEKKLQDEHEQKWSAKFSEISESFFNKILQHCQLQATPDFTGAKNSECERLLKETALETEKAGAL